MATRSVIAMEKDDVIFSAYCHWDGYLENNGEILNKHYRNPEKILQLISLGDMSSLGSEIGEKHDFDNREHKDWTCYYGRDRGEDGTESKTWDNRKAMIEHHWDCEYFYLWTNGDWVYSQGRSWLNLAEQLEIINAEKAE
jgi:hypothetical protein